MMIVDDLAMISYCLWAVVLVYMLVQSEKNM